MCDVISNLFFKFVTKLIHFKKSNTLEQDVLVKTCPVIASSSTACVMSIVLVLNKKPLKATRYLHCHVVITKFLVKEGNKKILSYMYVA